MIVLKPVAPMTAIMQPTVIAPPNTLGMSLHQVQPAHISGFSPALLTPAQLGVNNLIGTGICKASTCFFFHIFLKVCCTLFC